MEMANYIFLRRIRLDFKRSVNYYRTYGFKAFFAAIKHRTKAILLTMLSRRGFSTQRNTIGSSTFKLGSKFNSYTYDYVLNSTASISLDVIVESITWIVPEFGKSSGGHRTIFRHIANLSKLGIRSTIAILEVGQSFSVEKARCNLPKDLDLSELDIIMAKDLSVIHKYLVVTSWHTAYWAREIAKRNHCISYYFIQDNESMFYPCGSFSLLAQQTYSMPYRHIYASDWLANTLSQYSIDKKKRVVNLGVDEHEFPARPAMVKKRKERIITNQILQIGVYYRPVTARRMDEHAYLLLEYISRKRLKLKLHFFGWDWSKYDWPSNSLWHTNHGIVEHSELNCLLESLDCCLLLGSTNISLMPLEVISTGLPVFVNEGENNSCLLADLPFYISSIPEIGFNQLVTTLENRNALVEKIDHGIKVSTSKTWKEQSEILFKMLSTD